MNYLTSIWNWCVANPAIAWPVLTAILTALVKPRTAEQYEAIAKVSPRLAAFLRLLGAIGFDAPKAVQSLKEIAAKKKKAESSALDGALPILLSATLLALTCTSCAAFQKGARTALDVTQVACIIANQTFPEENVAKVCDIAEDLIPPMRKVLADSRKASAKAATEATAAAAAKCEGK